MCLAFLPGGKLEFNKWYVKSIPGILGIAAVVSVQYYSDTDFDIM